MPDSPGDGPLPGAAMIRAASFAAATDRALTSAGLTTLPDGKKCRSRFSALASARLGPPT
jgi:hypothetical protein